MHIDVIWASSWQNQQNGMCTQWRLRSAWASAQSDQSLRCPHEESFGPYQPIERTAKTLIRLGGCPGWSESSLGAHVSMLVLSRGGSYLLCFICIFLHAVFSIGSVGTVDLSNMVNFHSLSSHNAIYMRTRVSVLDKFFCFQNCCNFQLRFNWGMVVDSVILY